MQTQCPHCKSQYAVSADMVDAYGGFVRCGKCNYKFNIHDQALTIRYKEKAQDKIEPQFDRNEKNSDLADRRIEPRIEAEPDDDSLNIRFRETNDDLEEDIVEEDIVFDPSLESEAEEQLNEPPEQGRSPSFPSLDDFDDEEIDLSLDDGFGDDPDELKDALASLLDDDVDDLDDINTEFDTDAIGGDEDDQWEILLEEADKEDIDSVADLSENDDLADDLDDLDEDNRAPISFNHDEEDNFADESPVISLINDEAEISERSESGTFLSVLSQIAAFLFWTVAAIALAYFLFGQIKDKLYPAYKNHPLVQNIRAGVCDYLPCSEIKYDTDAYEIVVSRMDEINLPERQLHISIFMLNTSNTAQVYPNVLITLKRLDGSIAGQRAITPQEYFKSHDSFVDTTGNNANPDQLLIKPNKLGKVLIKLDKPPADAVGFEARIVH